MTWKDPDLGSILGCGILDLKHTGNAVGSQRLYRIIISESARLIWLLRNEIPEIEISNRWMKMINGRLNLDKNMTRHCPRS
ncbi:hypothetical protein L218DRAFT_876363 [Marasmius fiardii PR-910]|nr:hypothetical protein L218DRAFT_876363 [Marasmius fiardii PR-910]